MSGTEQNKKTKFIHKATSKNFPKNYVDQHFRQKSKTKVCNKLKGLAQVKKVNIYIGKEFRNNFVT